MKLHVFVATTQGLVAIQKIYDQDADIQSVVSIRGTSTISPITAAYHNFVRKGAGIIESDFAGSSYRINIDGHIDQGNSWQLGFYLAHAAYAQNILGDGVPQAGDRVICATGELNTSERSVLAVDQVPLKMTAAQDVIHQWPEEIDCLFILPSANVHEVNGSIAHCQVEAVSALEEALQFFPALAASAVNKQPLVHSNATKGGTNKTPISLAKIGTATALTAALAFGAYQLNQNGYFDQGNKELKPANTVPQTANVDAPLQVLPTKTAVITEPLDTPSNITPTPLLRLGKSASGSCDGELAFSDLLLEGERFSPAELHNVCVVQFESAIQYKALIVINLQSHRMLKATKTANAFTFRPPSSSAKYAMLGFTTQYTESEHRTVRRYLFNLADKQVVDINAMIALLGLDLQQVDVLYHQFNSFN